MADAKVTHDVLIDGGFCSDPQAGDLIRFFSKSMLKHTGQLKGPLVFAPISIEPRFLNLLLFSPLLYQATQRAKLDAIDLQEKFLALGAPGPDKPNVDYTQLASDIMGQLIALQEAMTKAQNAALNGIPAEVSR